MSETFCPICAAEMNRIVVTPCYDCGHDPIDTEHAYRMFEIFGQRIALCGFCEADFGSYDPEYFGLPEEHPMSYPLQFVHEIVEQNQGHDFYCKRCRHRMAFLKFLVDAREANDNAI